MKDDEGLWEVADVAAYLKVPEASVYKMTRQGAPTPIPHVKLGGLLRFRKRDIDRWLDLLMVSNLDRLERTRRAASRAS
jgi:excisionase family DNA binding protein